MNVSFGEGQVASCKKAFAASLKEGSSTIGLEQVREIVKAVGVEAKEEEIVALFKESDADGSGGIDEAEFVELVKKVQAKAGGRSLFDGASSLFSSMKLPSSMFSSNSSDPSYIVSSSNLLDDVQVSSWQQTFRSHLKEGNSTLCLVEIQAIVKSLGSDATEEDVSEFFKDCDADGSGAIGSTEFEVLMKMTKSLTIRKKPSRSFFSFF